MRQLADIEKFLQKLEPYRLVQDLKHSIKQNKSNRQFYTSCYPHERKNLTVKITTRGFIDENPLSEFIAGDCIDFLAFIENNSYKRAVLKFFDLYEDEIKDISVHEKSFLVEQLVLFYENKRNLFKRVFALENNNKTMVQFPKATTFLLNRKINPKYINRFVFLARAPELFDILTLYFNEDSGEFPELDENAEYLVFPYFSDPHTIAHIRILNTENSEVVKLDIALCKFSFAGVHANLKVDFKQNITRIFDSELSALAMDSFYKDSVDEKPCFAFNFNPKGRDDGSFYLERGLFLFTDKTNLPNLAKLQSKFDANQFFVIRFNNYHESTEVFGWLDFIKEEFKSLVLQDRGFSPRISAFLSAIGADTKLRHQLLKFLVNQVEDGNRYYDIIEKLEVGDEERIFNFKNYNVHETPHGYVVHPHNSMDKFVITNFIIKVDKNLIFEDSNDIMHHGRLITNGKEYPISFLRKELAKGDTIEMAAMRSFKQFNKGGDEERVPMICDRTYGGCLPTILNSQASNASQETGVSYLGWNADKTKFITPNFTCDRQDIKWKRRDKLQTRETLNIYSFKPFKNIPTESLNIDKIPEEFTETVSIICGYLLRGYLGYEIKPVVYKDCVGARNLFKSIFFALGQVKPLDINPNPRLCKEEIVFEGLNQIPVYAKCPHLNSALNLRYPMVLLHNDGWFIDSKNIELGIYPELTVHAYNIFSQVINYLIRTECLDIDLNWMLDESVLENLILDGRNVINKACDEFYHEIFNRNVIFPATSIVFRSFTFEELNKALSFDLENQVYALARANIRKPLREAVIELRDNKIKHACTNGYFLLDTEFTNSMVLKIFGKPLDPCKAYKGSKQEEFKDALDNAFDCKLAIN